MYLLLSTTEIPFATATQFRKAGTWQRFHISHKDNQLGPVPHNTVCHMVFCHEAMSLHHRNCGLPTKAEFHVSWHPGEYLDAAHKVKQGHSSGSQGWSKLIKTSDPTHRCF